MNDHCVDFNENLFFNFNENLGVQRKPVSTKTRIWIFLPSAFDPYFWKKSPGSDEFQKQTINRKFSLCAFFRNFGTPLHFWKQTMHPDLTSFQKQTIEYFNCVCFSETSETPCISENKLCTRILQVFKNKQSNIFIVVFQKPFVFLKAIHAPGSDKFSKTNNRIF